MLQKGTTQSQQICNMRYQLEIARTVVLLEIMRLTVPAGVIKLELFIVKVTDAFVSLAVVVVNGATDVMDNVAVLADEAYAGGAGNGRLGRGCL